MIDVKEGFGVLTGIDVPCNVVVRQSEDRIGGFSVVDVDARTGSG